jgi:hypothetical protein
METEDTEIRFGVMAVRMGFASPDQIVGALDVQVKENLFTGRHRRIGAILLDQGILSRSQMQEVAKKLDQTT